MNNYSNFVLDFSNSSIYKNTVLPTEIRRQITNNVNLFRTDTAFYSANFLVEKYQSGRISISKRNLSLLSRQNKSSFIESLLLGLPTTMLYFKNSSRGIYQTLRGSSAIWVLNEFFSNSFPLEGMRKVTKIEGMSYSELPISQRNAILTSKFESKVLSGYFDKDLVQLLLKSVNPL